MFAAVAAIAGVVAAGAGVYGAVSSAGAMEDAADTAAGAQRDAASQASATQRYIFNEQKKLNAPYQTPGLAALPQLQAAILGGPVSYLPEGYESLKTSDVAAENLAEKRKLLTTFDPHFNDSTFWAPWSQENPNRLSAMANKYDEGQTWYRGPNGELTNVDPTKTVEAYQPTKTPAYEWQLGENTRNLDRTLRSLGRSNSTYGLRAMSDMQSGLAAGEYDKGIARLSGLVDIGQRSAGAQGSALSDMGNSLSALQMQTGQANANAAYAKGNAQAGLYSGIGGAVGNTIGTGLNLYNAGQTNGWWGGGNTLSGIKATGMPYNYNSTLSNTAG